MTALDDVQRILIEELGAHERLLELKQAERRCLMRGAPDEILGILDEIRATSCEIESCEARREASCRELARERQLSAERPTLREIAAALPECQSADWAQLQTKLRRTLRELHRINHENRYLVRGSLAWVAEAVGSLLGQPGSGGTYDGTGIGPGSAARAVLVNQTV